VINEGCTRITLAIPVALARIASGVGIDRVLFWLMVAGLAWCPFWFGSNDLIAWGINAIIFPALAALYELSLLVRRESHPVGMKQIVTPAALFGAVVAFVLVQNYTGAPSAMAHPIWQMTAEALERSVAGSISVNRDLTMLALLRLVTAASVFWLALQLCRDTGRAYLLLNAIALIAAAYAPYGLIAFAVTPGYVLSLPTKFLKGYVTSTFIDPDSFATYAGMALVVACGLILRRYRHEVLSEGGPAGFKIASFIEVTGRQGALLLAIGFVIAISLLLSGSRSGIAATALGLFVFGTLSVQRRSAVQDRRKMIVVVAVLVAAVALAFGDAFLVRMAEQGTGDESRMSVYRIIMGAIGHSPVFGFGYGAFADVFPLYRDRSLSVHGKWVTAHNTYLEVFQDLGLLFGGLLIASIALLAYQTVKDVTTRQLDTTVPCMVAGTAALVGVHSLAGSSLQIQAVTLTFAALLGAGVARSVSSRRVVQTVRGARFVTIIVVVACGLVIWKGWEIVGFRFAQARAQDRAEAASAWTSVSGVASYALDAVVSAPLEPINPQTVARRLDEIGALLSVRPLASEHWFSLSAMRRLAGQPMEKVLAASRLSFSTGPNEGDVLLQRAMFCLSMWEDLPAAIQWRVAKDLAVPGFSGAEKAKLRTVVSSQPQSVRTSVRDLMREQGAASIESLSELGL
jgi:O-antigen ligase